MQEKQSNKLQKLNLAFHYLKSKDYSWTELLHRSKASPAILRFPLPSEIEFSAGGGAINWFPGHMTAATRAIQQRLKLSDFIIEVRDCRIPLSSVNADLQTHLSWKRRVVALNKKDLANTNVVHKWVEYYESRNLDCLPICAHSGQLVKKLLDLVQLKLKKSYFKGTYSPCHGCCVPNVGKSALINSIHQIASSRFPGERMKRVTVGPLPGVTQDIAGYMVIRSLGKYSRSISSF